MVTLLESSLEVTPCRDRGIASPLRTSRNSLVPCEEKSLLSRLLERQRDVSEEDAACGGISAGGHLHSTFTVPSTALSVLFVLSTTTLATPAWVKVGARGRRATLQARLAALCKNLERERDS